MKIGKIKLALPLWFVVLVLILTLLPDLFNLLGFDFGKIGFASKSFIHTVLELFCIATAFLIVFISVIDFKIKGDVSTPLVAFTMLCSGVLDMVHVLASNNFIFQSSRLTFISIYTWTLSRTFNAFILLMGAGLFLVQSDNLFKNVRKHNQKFLFYVIGGFIIITVAYVFCVLNLSADDEKMLTPYVLQRVLDIIPLLLYLFALTIIFPKFYTNHPSAFSQTLLLSLIPSISAQLHVVSGFTLPYDNAAMIAYYEKLISYVIPFAGIGMNYLQTHYNEIQALHKFKTESHERNILNELLEGVMDASLNGILVFENVLNEKNDVVNFRCIVHNKTSEILTEKPISNDYLITDIFPGDNSLVERCKLLVKNQEPAERESYIPNLKKWLRISDVPFKQGFVKTFFDITAAKEAEEVLLKREAMLSQAELVGQMGSWEWDLKTDKVVWSDQLGKMYGYTKEEYGNHIEDGLKNTHPEDAVKLRKLLEKAVAEKSSFEIEIRRTVKDGTTKHIFSKGKVFTDENGNAERILAVNLDITNNKALYLKSKHNEMLYEAFASNMPDTEVLLFDENYKITLADGNINDSPLTDKDSLVGKEISEVLSLINLDINPETILYTNPSSQTQFTHEFQGRFFRIHTRAISFNEGDVINGMLLIQDITEIKKAELELELKVTELDRSNTELENFAYVASHDLQEPLRKITSFGDRLRGKYTEQMSEEAQDYLNRMINATARMQKLITDLLTFSRITRPEEPFRKVDLNLVVKDILNDVEIATSANNAILNIESLPAIEALPSQMHQLLQNLLLNSIKFRKPDNTPEITIKSEKVNGADYGLSKFRTYYKISVIDNGIGFDDKYADKIFALFQRLHGRTEYAGTGIGLAVCKKIVEFHHGKIFAESSEGNGAIFNIILPADQISLLK